MAAREVLLPLLLLLYAGFGVAQLVNSTSSSNATTILSTLQGNVNDTLKSNQTSLSASLPSTSATSSSTRPPTLPTSTTTSTTTSTSTSTATTPAVSTLLPPVLLDINKDKVVITVIVVPISENIQVQSWQVRMEALLAKLCKEALLRLLLSIQNNNNRQKRLAVDGDVKVQLIQAARPNPSIKEKVSLAYIVSKQGSILPGVQVERAIGLMEDQEVALVLEHLVDTPAQALEGTELYRTTDPPALSVREIGLIVGLSVISGLVVIGVIIWFVCCCFATQARNRAEFRRIDVEDGRKPNLISASALPEPVVTHQSETATRALPDPSSGEKYKNASKPSSSDDGFSEDDSKAKRSNASSSPPASRYSSHTNRSSRNRIAPSLATDDTYVEPTYASINKLPPLDASRRYLVSSQADMAELEYYRNKQHNRSRRSSGRYMSPRSSRVPAKRSLDMDSDTGLETDELLEDMDENRTRMHRLLDDVLAIASPTPSKKLKSGSTTASSKKKNKKGKKDKKDKKKDKNKKASASSDSSSSSSSSSGASSSSSSSKKSGSKSGKSSDKSSKSSKKKSKSKKVEPSENDSGELKDVPHKPLNLGSTGDPYSQFSVSPYAASDTAAHLQLGSSAKTSAWLMDSPMPTADTSTMGSTKHDWSTRKTLHIPKPKLGTPELNQLANIKSAANDDNYTSLVLTTAMFRAQSPSWEETTA